MSVTQGDLKAAAADRTALGDLLDRLAADAAAGDRDALELLVWAVDELEPAMPAIRGVLINQSDIEDVHQDVLVALAETIGGFRGESRFRTWLNQMARFKAIDHLRRKRDTESLHGQEYGDAFRISSVLAGRTTLRDVLEALPESYREAVVLRDVEQLPYDELARRLDVNINTAKSRVARGRALAAHKLVERR